MSYYAWPGVALTQSNIERLLSATMALDIDALQLATMTTHCAPFPAPVYSMMQGGLRAES